MLIRRAGIDDVETVEAFVSRIGGRWRSISTRAFCCGRAKQ